LSGVSIPSSPTFTGCDFVMSRYPFIGFVCCSDHGVVSSVGIALHRHPCEDVFGTVGQPDPAVLSNDEEADGFTVGPRDLLEVQHDAQNDFLVDEYLESCDVLSIEISAQREDDDVAFHRSVDLVGQAVSVEAAPMQGMQCAGHGQLARSPAIVLASS